MMLKRRPGQVATRGDSLIDCPPVAAPGATGPQLGLVERPRPYLTKRGTARRIEIVDDPGARPIDTSTLRPDVIAGDPRPAFLRAVQRSVPQQAKANGPTEANDIDKRDLWFQP